MTQPHHHVFNVLQGEINHIIKLDPLFPLLLERGVFRPEEKRLFETIGMKALTGYLRGKDFETFLSFISCISDHPTQGSKYLAIIKAVKEILNSYDEQHKSSHAFKVDEISKRHEKPADLTSFSSSKGLRNDQKISAVLDTDDPLSLPRLPYLEEPQTFTLNEANNYSCRKYEQEYGLTIEGYPGEAVTFRIGLCTHGPFAIPDIYKVATCFLCIAANTRLIKPIKITMQHCLLIPSYDQSSSVLILHADHTITSTDANESFMFSTHFKFGGMEGKRKIHPLVSTNESILSFELQDLCVLCGVLEEDGYKDMSLTKESPHNDITNSLNFSDKENVKRTDTFSSLTSLSTQPLLEKPLHNDSNQQEPRRVNFKRQHPNNEDRNKRICKTTIEYCLLLIEPARKSSTFSIFIFVLENCLTSLKECTRQGKLLCMTDDILKSPINGTFSNSRIHFDVVNDNNHWTVKGKTSPNVSVSENDIHIKKTKASFYAKENLFPPRIEFIVSSKDTRVTSDLLFRIDVFGFECSDCSSGSVSFNITASPPLPPSNYTSQPVPLALQNKFYSLPSHVKESILVNNDFALKIYQDIHDWKRIGGLLGIPHYDLEALEYNNHCPGKHQLEYEVFLKWFEQTLPTQRRLDYIANVLIQANENTAFQSFISYCILI